jgi:hypothetical protein
MTKEQIAKNAGFESYEQLARDFRVSCDGEETDGKIVKITAGSLYHQLYFDGAK